MEELESLRIAFMTLAKEHQEMKQKILLLEKAVKRHLVDEWAHKL